MSTPRRPDLPRRQAVTGLLLAAMAVWIGVASHPRTAGAHARSLSYSHWDLAGAEPRVTVRIPRLELTRLGLDPGSQDPSIDARLADYLATHLQLSAGGDVCAPIDRPRPRSAKEGWAAYTWRLSCTTLRPLEVRSSILLEAAPSHLHFARVRLPEPRESVLERVLSEGAPSWTISAAATPGELPNTAPSTRGATLTSYLLLGVEHILTGWDHLAFLFALLLLAGTLGEVAGLVTAFTVAHSITLGMAALGWVEPEAAAVEAVIGFSVALVAAENSWLMAGRDRLVPVLATLGMAVAAGLAAMGLAVVSPLTLAGLALFGFAHFGLLERSKRPARLRVALAFVFGLVHGFGFAGVLGEMDLPRARLIPALFGFNVGVELGQLGVVVLTWPLLRAITHIQEGRWYRPLAETGSAIICGLGLFWFVSRSFGAG